MRKLLLLAIVLALLSGADLALRTVAERRLESRAARAAGEGAEATAEIGSFPFVPRLLLAGSVPEVRVRASPVTAAGLLFDAVEVELDGVELDRGALYGGQLRLQDIDAGTVTVEIGGGLLTDALDLPIEVEEGLLRVVVAGQPVTARAEVADGMLVVTVAGLPALRLEVPRTDLSPCLGAEVSVSGDRLRISCSIGSVPAGLLP